MRFTKSFDLPASPEKVGEVICGEAFNVEEGNSRLDVVSTEYKLVEQTEDRIQFEVHYMEYKRTKLGRIDKSGTTPSMTRNTYDVGKKILTWVYSSPAAGDRFSFSGEYCVEPQGAGTRVFYNADFEVRIPLIGNKIAKLMAREFEDDFPRLIRVVKKHTS